MSDEEDDNLMHEEIDLGHYEGERNSDDERHGFGKAYFPNGDTYEGMYERGKRHGKGFYQLVKGSYYDGDYVWNNKQGFGTMLYPDGAMYEGYWHDNCRQGRGKYTYVNGDEYDGEWFGNVKHGKGLYTNKAGNAKVEGTWVSGKLNGEVKIEFGDVLYFGTYEDNMVGGKGKFVFPKLSVELAGRYTVKETIVDDTMMDEMDVRITRSTKWSSHCLKLAEKITKKRETISQSQVN